LFIACRATFRGWGRGAAGEVETAEGEVVVSVGRDEVGVTTTPELSRGAGSEPVVVQPVSSATSAAAAVAAAPSNLTRCMPV
jgi:hypothetical protein